MAKYLDETGLKKYTELVKGDIEKKQNVLTGRDNEVVGFNGNGAVQNRVVVNSVNGKGDDIKIAGVNIFTGTKGFTGSNWHSNLNYWSRQNEQYRGLEIIYSNATNNRVSQIIHAVPGEQYTFSCYAKVDEPHDIKFYAVDNETDIPKVTINESPVVVTTDWNRYEFSFQILEALDIRPGIENTSEGKLYICGLMLERGNVATDWDTSPFDTITNDEIHGGTQILRSTANIVMGSGKWNDGSWRVGGASITSMIGTVFAPNAGIINGYTLINKTDNFGGYGQTNIPIVVGYPYVLSCYVKGKGDLALIAGNEPYVYHKISVNNSAWERAYFKFVAGEEVGAKDNMTNVFFEVANTDESGIEVCGEKLEVGVVPTDWSTSPLDAVKSGDFVSSINGVKGDVLLSGRNIVLNSGVRVENSEYLIANYNLAYPIELSRTYMITIWGTVANEHQFRCFFGSRSRDGSGALTRVSDGVYRVAYHAPASWTQADDDKSILKVFVFPNDSAGINSTIERIKIEAENVASEWTPAPEDLPNKSIASIDSELDGVDSRLQALEDADNNWLPKAGGTMTGDLDMGAHFVKSTSAPVATNDLTNKAYVDTQVKTAVDAANTAQTTAEGAETTANAAHTLALEAKGTAESAKTEAESASETANIANSAAEHAEQAASQAETDASEAKQAAQSALDLAQQAIDNVNGLVALTDAEVEAAWNA